MSQIKDRIEYDILVARRARDRQKIEVLSYAKDRILNAEKILFEIAEKPTFNEIQKKRKLLTLKEEASVLLNVIRSYETELEGLRRMKVQHPSLIKERETKISWLDRYLEELKQPEDLVDATVLEICIEHNINTMHDIGKAMSVTRERLCYEDQGMIYKKIKELIS